MQMVCAALCASELSGAGYSRWAGAVRRWRSTPNDGCNATTVKRKVTEPVHTSWRGVLPPTSSAPAWCTQDPGPPPERVCMVSRRRCSVSKAFTLYVALSTARASSWATRCSALFLKAGAVAVGAVASVTGAVAASAPAPAPATVAGAGTSTSACAVVSGCSCAVAEVIPAPSVVASAMAPCARLATLPATTRHVAYTCYRCGRH